MASRGPYAKGRERREAILTATVAAFSRTGYRGTSIRAIAQEIGITPTLIQHYFPTREELLTEVIRAWDEQNARASDGIPMIDGFLGNIRRNARIPGLVRLYTAYAVEASDPDHVARPFFRERYAAMTRMFDDDIRARQEAGTAPADLDPADTARLLIATCEGLQVRWLHDGDFDIHGAFWEHLGSLGFEPYRSSPPPVDAQSTSRGDETLD